MIVCEDMNKFRMELDRRGIDWQDVSDEGFCWICRTHFIYNGEKWSVINGYGTYGGIGFTGMENKGLLEVYDFNKEPIGFLTAEEAVQMIFGSNIDENI